MSRPAAREPDPTLWGGPPARAGARSGVFGRVGRSRRDSAGWAPRRGWLGTGDSAVWVAVGVRSGIGRACGRSAWVGLVRADVNPGPWRAGNPTRRGLRRSGRRQAAGCPPGAGIRCRWSPSARAGRGEAGNRGPPTSRARRWPGPSSRSRPGPSRRPPAMPPGTAPSSSTWCRARRCRGLRPTTLHVKGVGHGVWAIRPNRPGRAGPWAGPSDGRPGPVRSGCARVGFSPAVDRSRHRRGGGRGRVRGCRRWPGRPPYRPSGGG